MKLSFFNLSKDQTNIIKAVAIIVLVLHNFLHFTNDAKENEFVFTKEGIFIVIDYIKQDLVYLPNVLISYFGFYAIELFIFVSGYGLTKQFLRKGSTSVPYFKYLIPRLIKVYSLLLFGIVLFVFVFYREFTKSDLLNFALSYLLLYNNFTFDKIFQYIGPWWYFGFVIQLYIVFPFVYALLNKYKIKGLVYTLLIAYVILYILYPIATRNNIVLNATILGHLPEFAFGIAIALFPQIKIDAKMILVAFVVFILSCFYEIFYPLTYFAATILLLSVVYPLINTSLNNTFKKSLISVGGVSMFMFLINGPLRNFTIEYTEGKTPLVILLISIVHLLLVIVLSYVLSYVFKLVVVPIEKRIISLISR